VILGRPCLGIIDDFIRCKSTCFSITDGNTTKDVLLYPLAKPSSKCENPLCSKFKPEEANTPPLFTIGKALHFKN